MIILMVVFDKQTGELMNIAYNFTANSMGWAYLAITLIFFFVMIYIAVSKIGRLRLGGCKARPEFGTLTWIAIAVYQLFWMLLQLVIPLLRRG